jgi:ferritin-like protein
VTENRREADGCARGAIALTLEQLDGDGAIQESIAELYGETRANFLRKAVVGGATLAAALAEAPSLLAGPPSKETDVHIFQYALNFEYLQASFYTETERTGTVARMAARKAVWARTLGAHERAHVRIIKDVLGRAATKKPFFDFQGNTEDEDRFTRTAVAMEDLTTALLTGVTPALRSRELTAAAFSLLTVEARHAAWARHISGVVPVASAFDRAKPVSEVDRIVASTHFISTLDPKTTAKSNPRFVG